MAESTEPYSLPIPAILGNRVQLKVLRPRKGSTVPMRGAKSNQKPGLLG